MGAFNGKLDREVLADEDLVIGRLKVNYLYLALRFLAGEVNGVNVDTLRSDGLDDVRRLVISLKTVRDKNDTRCLGLLKEACGISQSRSYVGSRSIGLRSLNVVCVSSRCVCAEP